MQSIMLPIAIAALVLGSLSPLSAEPVAAAGITLDAGIGHAGNVYLTATDETADTFFQLSADTEYRHQLTEEADLYLNAFIDHQRYVTETEASETRATLFAELYYQETPWGIGISDRVSYADYRSFNEEGGILPAGHYEASINNLRVYGTWELADNQVFELGAVYRNKVYREAEFDLAELSFDLSHRWDITPKTFSDVTYRLATRQFRDLLALTRDGTADAANPLLQQNTTTLDLAITHRPSDPSCITLFAQLIQSEDDFEGAGSYQEQGVGIRSSIPLPARFTAAGSLLLSRRDFDNRSCGTTDDEQTDDFVHINIGLERALRRNLTAYGKANLSTRESNNPVDDYRDDRFSVGVKATW